MEQPKKSNKTKIVSVLLVAILTCSVIAIYSYAQTRNISIEDQIEEAFRNDVARIKVGYKIEVIDGDTGELKDTRQCEDDLPTANFANLIEGIFLDNFDDDEVVYASLRTTNDQLLTTYHWRAPAAPSIFRTDYDDHMGGWIYIGNGTNSPSYNDYTLDTYVAKGYTTSSVYSYPNVTVTSTVTVPYDQGVGISEAGLFAKMNFGTTDYDILMFRDTFTPVAANALDNLVVTYYFQLGGTSLTDNFGEIMAELFEEKALDSSPTFSMTDITGSSGSFSLWTQTGTCMLLSASNTDNNVGVRVGTSTAAEGSGNYTLGNDVSGGLKGFTNVVDPTLDVYGNNWNITAAATFQMSSSYTITEACVNVLYRNTGGTYKEIMIWRNTFSGYSYTAYDWINVAMRFMY